MFGKVAAGTTSGATTENFIRKSKTLGGRVCGVRKEKNVMEYTVICLRQNNLETFKAIVEHGLVNGFKINDPSIRGWPLLHHTCDLTINCQDNPEFLRYLITKCSADVNNSGLGGETPLTIVVRHGAISQCMIALLDLRADVNCRTQLKDTLIEEAIENSYTNENGKSLIWALLEYGANPSEIKTSFSRQTDLRQTVVRMVSGRKCAKRAAIVVMGIKRFRFSNMLKNNNKDVMKVIAKFIWKSRIEYEMWYRQDAQDNIRLKVPEFLMG